MRPRGACDVTDSLLDISSLATNTAVTQKPLKDGTHSIFGAM